MQANQDRKGSQAPSGVGALLRAYGEGRSSLVTAIAKAQHAVRGKAPVTLDRASPQAAPMVRALADNQVSNVRLLLLEGFDADTLLTNSSNREHTSLLMLAQSALSVRLLLDAGANPNARSDTYMLNPLTSVIKSMPAQDRIESVDMMLQAGADPNAGSGVGITPLECAVARPDLGVMMLLIEAGAQVDRHVVASLIHSHIDRSRRVTNDAQQLEAALNKTRQAVDLVVYASSDKELRQVLGDPEIARMLKLMPEVDHLFKSRMPDAPAVASKTSQAALN